MTDHEQAWSHPDVRAAVAHHDVALAWHHELAAVDLAAADRWHRDVVLPAVERMVDAYTAHGGSL